MLRKLNLKDAPFMLEWMHDEDIISGLSADIFRNKTINDCIEFINKSQDDKNDCHMAIVNKYDEYIGTVSLKHIDYIDKNAEFAIVLRKIAQGKGYAKIAVSEILDIAFNEYKLDEVYLNVLMDNEKAIGLYRSCGFIDLKNVNKKQLDYAPRNVDGNLKTIVFFHKMREF